MNSLFDLLSSALGAPAGQIKLIFCLLIAYPLSSIYTKIPQNQHQLKHAYNIGVSLFFLVPLLQLYRGTFDLLLSTTFTYLVAARVQSQNMPWIVFGFVMSHLLVNHMRRLYSSAEDLDITGSQMVLVMKLSTFAWNVYDGRRPTEDLDPSQLATRVTEYPTVLEFLGYVLYFPGLLIGPAFEFNTYRSTIDESIYTSSSRPQINGQANGSSKPKSRIPEGRNRAAYAKMARGLVFLVLFTVFGSKITLTKTLPAGWTTNPFWYRVIYVQAATFFVRTKYYGAWSLSDGATILSGLGFNGYTAQGKPRWDKAVNLHITNIEFAPNFKVLLDNWNINTNIWLRNCIYKRVTPKGKRPGFRSSMLTFLTSALWHGFSGGYYLTFVLGGFIQTVARQCRTYLRPLFVPPLLSPPPAKGQKSTNKTLPPPPLTLPKRVYDVLGVACTQLMLNYATAPFCLLTVRDSLTCWKHLAWYGHVVILVSLVFFKSPAKLVLTRAAKGREDRARLLAQGTPELIVLPPTPANEKFSDVPDVIPPVYQILDEKKVM